ncbi:phospholipase [Ceratobasidium sp. AG-Ba]|nr:phospholipase [Ceratobasidium sp. AG-Ba]
MEVDGPPTIFVQWYHAGPAELLSSAPVSLGSNVAWQTLTREESIACEAAWNSLTDEEKQTANEYVEEVKDVPPLEDEDDDGFLGVPVTVDKLFEINVKTMRLYPVFWRSPGPPIKVRRCVWMYDESRAVEPVLSRELEQAYHTIKPYLPSYPDEVQAALSIGTIEAQDKLKTTLIQSNYSVVFQDASTARIFQGSTPPSAGFFRFWGTGKGDLLAGATPVYRGVENAKAAGASSTASQGQEGRRMSISSLEESSAKRQKLEVAADASRTRRPGVHPPQSDSRPSSIKSEGGVPSSSSLRPPSDKRKSIEVVVEDVPPRPENTVVTDLVLVIHGIGQGYTAQYEAWDFTYATNLFRDIARKQSESPALASIMRSRRAQFLPVPWRASMKLALDEEVERARDGLDNRFTLSDITPKKAIPYVRELTNNVLIDIPYFMSQHRDKMIESVCLTANRAYRLWCARNPEFESHGRVHVIGHSLGSALAAHILSAQPTTQRPLAEFTQDELTGMSRHFLFNTSHLFMIGSPLGVFMHINQAQLIARKGRERTIDSKPDEALDRTGIFGCLAVDAVYNIFYPSDPIAYLLNPCVDSEHAKTMTQVTIPSVGTTVLTTIGSRITRMFDGLALPISSSPSRSNSPAPKTRSRAKESAKALNGDRGREDNGAMGDAMNLGETDREQRGDSRAERRALNPHGNVDFALPSEGKISDYVDMITAHGDYWSDLNFASFVLTEIFARKEDLLRTGVGLKF